MIKLFFTFILLQPLFFISCSQKESCDQLSKHFRTYDKALLEIKSKNFKIQESVNTSKSSWIKNASYYSCDGQIGFFILETSKKEYLYVNLPYQVWNEFKSAESFGSFYNKNIREKYNINLNK